MDILFNIVLVIYIVAVGTHFAGVGFKHDTLRKIAFITFILAVLGHIAFFIWRWITKYQWLDVDFIVAIPIRGGFEYAMAFALVIAVIVIIARPKMPWIVSAGMPASLALMLWAVTRDSTIGDMLPALRSPWIFVHAGTGVVAYGSFAVACVCGIKYLIGLKKGEDEESKIMIQIDRMSYRCIAFGMLFFTVTIITGSMWAADAWSRFWFWDPKELWSLITWIFYAIYLHQRLRKNWRGKRTAIMSLIGVALVLFTWIGVNNLLAGLHSYS